MFRKAVFRGLLSTFCLIAGPAIAADAAFSPDEAYNIGQEFSSCAGAYEALAQIAGHVSGPNSAEAFRGLARGYEMSAVFLLVAYGAIPNAEAARESVKSGMQIEMTNQLAVVETTLKDGNPVEAIKKKTNYCRDTWSELGTQVVDALKRTSYGAIPESR